MARAASGGGGTNHTHTLDWLLGALLALLVLLAGAALELRPPSGKRDRDSGWPLAPGSGQAVRYDPPRRR